METGATKRHLKHLWAWRSQLIFILVPILLSPLPGVVGSPESKCAYVVILMALYWVTECIPVAVTALLPVVLFPLFEIIGPEEIAKEYMNDINMLFLGGLMVAVAIEYWHIHKMVALRILTLVGSDPKWIMVGMMAATWFLSMWISNTATTAMMMPITEAILVELQQSDDPVTQNQDSKETTDVKDKTVKKKVSLEQVNVNVVGTHHSSEEIETRFSHGPNYEAISPTENPKEKRQPCQEKNSPSSPKQTDPHFQKIAISMLLSICYAANCGGIASLTGTGPNLVLKREADKLYESNGLQSPINFGKWMTLGIPVSFVVLVLSWCWLQLWALPCRGGCHCCGNKSEADEEKKRRITQIIKDQWNALGSMVCGQVMVLGLFFVLVVLWITRDLGGVSGWGGKFNPKLKDGTSAIFISLLVFAAPATFPFLKSYPVYSHPETDPRYGLVTTPLGQEGGDDDDDKSEFKIRPLLSWKVATQKFSWGLVLLMGGGYAISAGCQKSGLSPWIGEQLTYFKDWNEYAILFIICYITAAATEFASNTAMASIMMPILQRLALSTGVHPLKYMFASCFACSFAYMLPVATPPNAIVFATGRIRIPDMIKVGALMNLMAVPVLVVIITSLGNVIYDFDDIPQQFLNLTLTSVVSI